MSPAVRMVVKILPFSFSATASASFLSLEIVGLELGALALEHLAVVFGGAQRFLLRQQEVAGVAVLDGDDVAHLAELADALKQDDLHVLFSL